MKISQLIILSGLVACASAPGEKKKTGPEAGSHEAFKKVKPLSPKEVPDYYPVNSRALSPALQDETLDRYTNEEVATLNDQGDALLGLSVLCQKRDFTKAFAKASAIHNQYQKIPAYWTQVANCHLNQGSHRKALLFYNKALELSPNYVPALNNIGVMYSRLGQDQKALVAFEKANNQSKFAKTPRYNLAKISLRYGLFENSLPMFQGLLNEAPNDVGLLNSVGTAYFLMSDYQRAMSYYRQIPLTEWKNPEIGLNAALTLKKVGRADDAKKIFASISEPASGELKSYYAVIQKQLGE